MRDARITTIYEGTTGIQANDLIGRKIARDGGKALAAAIATMRDVQRALRSKPPATSSPSSARACATGVDALEDAGRWIVTRFGDDPRAVLAGAVPFLELAGIVCGGAQLGRAALVAAKKLAAGDGDAAFLRAKIATARHFADHCLTQAAGIARHRRRRRAQGVLALADDAVLSLGSPESDGARNPSQRGATP